MAKHEGQGQGRPRTRPWTRPRSRPRPRRRRRARRRPPRTGHKPCASPGLLLARPGRGVPPGLLVTRHRPVGARVSTSNCPSSVSGSMPRARVIGSARPARGAGDGHLRQGRIMRYVVGAFDPQGVGTRPSGADQGGACAPLPLADHQRAAAAGEIGVFDRSQYEDVLIVRVHDLVPAPSGRVATRRSTPGRRRSPTRAPRSSRSCCTSPATSRRRDWGAARPSGQVLEVQPR